MSGQEAQMGITRKINFKGKRGIRFNELQLNQKVKIFPCEGEEGGEGLDWTVRRKSARQKGANRTGRAGLGKVCLHQGGVERSKDGYEEMKNILGRITRSEMLDCAPSQNGFVKSTAKIHSRGNRESLSNGNSGEISRKTKKKKQKKAGPNALGIQGGILKQKKRRSKLISAKGRRLDVAALI